MCNKRTYTTLDDAECALARVILDNWRGKLHGGIGSYYYCADCEGYHITRYRDTNIQKLKELYSYG
jgi:hypothetical protein